MDIFVDGKGLLGHGRNVIKMKENRSKGERFGEFLFKPLFDHAEER